MKQTHLSSFLKKVSLVLSIFFLLHITVQAQRSTLPIGSEIIVKEITSWDPEYKNKDLIVGKKAVVSKRPLLFSFDDHWSGFITVGGVEYRLLDMRIQILTGLVPEKKEEPKDVLKLQSQLKELVELSTKDFSTIKTNIPKSIPYKYGASFLSTYQINGTKDSSTIIYFDESSKRWNLQTTFNTKLYSAEGIDYMLRTLDLPCGKLEELPISQTFSPTTDKMYLKYYVPVNRKQSNNKYQTFTIQLTAEFYKGETVFLMLSLLNYSFEPSIPIQQTSSSKEATGKDFKKMESDILVLVEEFKTEFKNIKSNIKTNDSKEAPEYKSTCKLEGSTPGYATVYFDTLNKSWSLNVPMDTDKYSSDEIDKLLLNMNFPFGKLERQIINFETDSKFYKPKDRFNVSEVYKKLDVMITSYKSNGKEIMLGLVISKSSY